MVAVIVFQCYSGGYFLVIRMPFNSQIKIRGARESGGFSRPLTK